MTPQQAKSVVSIFQFCWFNSIRKYSKTCLIQSGLGRATLTVIDRWLDYGIPAISAKVSNRLLNDFTFFNSVIMYYSD